MAKTEVTLGKDSDWEVMVAVREANRQGVFAGQDKRGKCSNNAKRKDDGRGPGFHGLPEHDHRGKEEAGR